MLRSPYPAELTDALQAWGADETGHSGRAMLDHLIGTADHLQSWGAPPEIVLAGLFHSVYGTQSFLIQSVPFERRAEVAALIGAPAEELAWLFCVLKRRALWAPPTGETRALSPHATGEPLTIPEGQVTQLLEIEVANLLDQLPPRDQGGPERAAYMAEFQRAVQDRVSKGAREALKVWMRAD